MSNPDQDMSKDVWPFLCDDDVDIEFVSVSTGRHSNRDDWELLQENENKAIGSIIEV